MTPPGRCPRCSRILFLTKGNKLPPHRVPAKAARNLHTDKPVSVPLTGTGQPWCAGIG